MNVDLGYWIYYLKLRGHFFVAAMGTTVAVAAVWLFRILVSYLSPRNSYIRHLTSDIFMFVSTGVLYPLIGFYGLLATLLMGVLLWRLEKQTITQRIIGSVVAGVSIVFWPLFCYNYVYCQTNIQNIWWTGLPLFIVDKELPNYYIPYYILVTSLVFLALMYGRWKEEVRGKKEEVRRQKFVGVCSSVSSALSVFD